MAALTLGFTGMDASTETELRHAFEQALPASGGGWQLVADTHADYVVVDMDSMYGPMSWLRLHAAGKHVVGLTAAPRTQTPYRLGRPVGSDELATLLRDIRTAAGMPGAEGSAATPRVAEAAPARPSGMTPSPEPMDQLPEERPSRADAMEFPSNPAAITEPAAVADEPPSVAVGQVLPPAPSIEPAAAPVMPTADGHGTVDTPAQPFVAVARPAPVDTPAAAAPAPIAAAAPTAGAAPATPSAPLPPTASTSAADARPADASAASAPGATPPPPAPTRSAEPRTLADWLASGRVRGRVRFGSGSTAVLIDSDQRQYFGPATLKATAPLFERDATLADFEPVSADIWSAQTSALAAPQPLARLIWFGALVAGQGRLAAGYDASERFKLTKWPQTEREFPKHFRIATAMMKGPATVAEIAEASSVPEADVADFVNASLATGFAEPHRDTEPEPDGSRTGGLFGRLRGR